MSWLTQELRSVRWRIRQKYFHDFVFIHIPKTGGTSIGKALGTDGPHLTAAQLRGRLGRERWERKFKFAFVRNPWDKAVSSFHHAAFIERDSRFTALTFRDWLRLAYVERHPLYFDRPHTFAPQLHWIADIQNNLLVDFVGRFENLRDDFRTICERIGRRATVLPHYHYTPHDDYRSYYTDRDAEIIASWYQLDIDYFGYVFSAPTVEPARQLSAVGSRPLAHTLAAAGRR